MYGENDGNSFKVDDTVISSRDFYRLKTNNLIYGESNKVSFTDRGKDVIKTMSLGEQNAFLKDSKPKDYHEILASTNKRGKSGYRVAQNTLIDLKSNEKK